MNIRRLRRPRRYAARKAPAFSAVAVRPQPLANSALNAFDRQAITRPLSTRLSPCQRHSTNAIALVSAAFQSIWLFQQALPGRIGPELRANAATKFSPPRA